MNLSLESKLKMHEGSVPLCVTSVAGWNPYFGHETDPYFLNNL